MLMKVICGLSKEESYKIKKLEDKGKSAFNQKIDLQNQNVGISW